MGRGLPTRREQAIHCQVQFQVFQFLRIEGEPAITEVQRVVVVRKNLLLQISRNQARQLPRFIPSGKRQSDRFGILPSILPQSHSPELASGKCRPSVP